MIFFVLTQLNTAKMAEYLLSCHNLYFAHYQLNKYIYNNIIHKKNAWHKD